MNQTSPSGRLFVVAAPSGAGKTSLCKALLERLNREGNRELRWSCSYTTRKPRAGEVHGQDYFFVDDETFGRMIEAGEFAEWAHVHDRRYGTSRAYLDQAAATGMDLLVEIDIQGARSLKQQKPDACFIFVLPPDWPTLARRLRGRATESDEEIERRLDTARTEILEWSWFDYIIVNQNFDRSVDLMRAVVLSRRSLRVSMSCTVKEILDTMGDPSAGTPKR